MADTEAGAGDLGGLPQDQRQQIIALVALWADGLMGPEAAHLPKKRVEGRPPFSVRASTNAPNHAKHRRGLCQLRPRGLIHAFKEGAADTSVLFTTNKAVPLPVHVPPRVAAAARSAHLERHRAAASGWPGGTEQRANYAHCSARQGGVLAGAHLLHRAPHEAQAGWEYPLEGGLQEPPGLGAEGLGQGLRTAGGDGAVRARNLVL
jgi:hypothetical protein